MSKWIVELQPYKTGGGLSHALVRDLPEDNLLDLGTYPDTWINVSSCVTRGEGEIFYAGVDDQRAENLKDALHIALYDLYQTSGDLHDGDTFECNWNGVVYQFRCEGVHVVPIN